MSMQDHQPTQVQSLCLAGLIALGGHAYAQDYPNRPIRMLTSEVGSGSDVTGRLISEAIPARLGQPGIVENRGVQAPEITAKAAPDGYTLVLYSTPLWVKPFLQDHVPWDPIRDFAPIMLGVSTPNVLAVHPSLPAKSVRELVTLAKNRPAILNYGSGGAGSSSHLAAELLNSMAGISITRIPYKGVGPATIGLMGGEIHLVFVTGSAVGPHIRSGRLRALAVTSAKPTPLFAGMPTVAESGLPGYESTTPMGIFAPAGTPAAIIARLNQTISAILGNEDIRKRIFDIGAEVISSSPTEFAAYLKSDMARWGKLIKDKGIRE